MDILINNKKITEIFQEIVIGKYSEIDFNNLLIKKDDLKNYYFVISEVDESNSISNFIEKYLLNKGINENQIEFESTTFNISVVEIIQNENNFELKNLSLFEYLFSIHNMDYINIIKFFTDNNFSLFHYNIKTEQENFIKTINELLEDNNFKEILEEKII